METKKKKKAKGNGVGGDNKAAFNFGLPGIDHDK